MLRGLSHLAAAASLLLFIATVALWVRGRQRMDHFWLIHGDDGSELVRSDRGRITVRHTRPNGRSRITLPRRVSHWACEVGSQLPPKRSPNHWQWRFLTYEGVGAATRGEVAAAKTAKQQAEATLMQSRGALRRPIDQRDPVAMAAYTQQLWAARRADQVVENADQVLHGSNYWEWTFPA